MGESFGGYTLLRPIGVGGMAEVFLARHVGVEGFEKEVVIKRIRPHLSATPAFINMFLAEAKLASQLNHPNIVQIFDLGKIKDSYFIAMEYISGRDMSVVLPKSKKLGIPFPIEYALKIASSVCEALYFAHSKADPTGAPLNIVHRDVSPENIRVAWTGTIKILDFGIAKATTQLHETKTGEIKGKLSYMAPEQILGREVDQRSDIFSLGIVLYEWLTGLKLFSGENDLAIMNNIIEGKIYPPTYFRADVPPAVEAIVMRALEKNRRRRYQTACDMQLEIDTFLADNEFTPSNIHLANFMKQLFADELEAERERDRKLTPTFTPNPGPDNEKPSKAKPPPPPFGAGLLDQHSEILDLPADEVCEDPLSDGVVITIEGEDAAKLRELAQKKSTNVEAIVHDILAHYLKFQP